MRTGELTGKAVALLLALVLACGLFSAALADAAATSSPQDVDLIMARNAVVGYSVRGADGQLLEPRRASEMTGRGVPDEPGVEPDYRGVVGYAALQPGWEVSRFSTFTQTPWQIPVYEEKAGEFRRAGDPIKHKTPVLVIDQQLQEDKAHHYSGYLKVVRLDIHRIVWIDVTRFVTVPYWTYSLDEAVRHGYCIAVYRDRTRHEPIDRKEHRGTLPDGLKVLMCCTASAPYTSPDSVNNPLLGIVFWKGDGSSSHTRTFLFFNQEDLTLIY